MTEDKKRHVYAVQYTVPGEARRRKDMLHADTAAFAEQTVKEAWLRDFGVEITRLRANREW